MGEGSKEELGLKYEAFCKEYKGKNNDELKKELAILYGQEDIVVSDRGLYSLSIAAIVGFLAFVATYVLPLMEAADIWILRVILVIFAVLCLYWLCKLYNYQHKDVAMRKQIIKMILRDRSRKSQKQKNEIIKRGDDDITFTMLVRR